MVSVLDNTFILACYFCMKCFANVLTNAHQTLTCPLSLPVACMFLGAAQQALLLPSLWSPTLLTGWLLWIVLADLLLLIHSCRLHSRGIKASVTVCWQTEKNSASEMSHHLQKLILTKLIGVQMSVKDLHKLGLCSWASWRLRFSDSTERNWCFKCLCE